MSKRNGLVGSVHELLDLAEPILRNPPGRIAELRERLDGPLRVAIAGKVKAGKSTLLNALVGEKVAPTDASECTRIVTWYRNSHLYRVTAVPYVGAPEELPFRRTEAEFEIALGSRSPEQLHYLDVEWPSERLRELILIDTPGLSSLSEDVSRRTEHYLSTDEEGPGEADAVIYLMRHLHPMDLSFLEAFKDHIATRGASVNSIAVLSRADEIGACRPNALGVAERVAQRYRHDPRVQTHCQAVLPVAGLIAEAAATLREDETTALRTLAALDREVSTEMLRSAERFASLDDRSGIDINLRRRLLDRLGLFGVRLAVELLISGKVTSAGDLSRELEARSGIGELRRILTGQFAARAAVLKARSTLASTLALAELHGGSDGPCDPGAGAGHPAQRPRARRDPPADPDASGQCGPRRRRARGPPAARRRRARTASPPRASPVGERQRGQGGRDRGDRPLAPDGRRSSPRQGGPRDRRGRDPQCGGDGGGAVMIICRKCSRRHPDGTDFCACGAFLEFDGERAPDEPSVTPTVPASPPPPADDARVVAGGPGPGGSHPHAQRRARPVVGNSEHRQLGGPGRDHDDRDRGAAARRAADGAAHGAGRDPALGSRR